MICFRKTAHYPRLSRRNDSVFIHTVLLADSKRKDISLYVTTSILIFLPLKAVKTQRATRIIHILFFFARVQASFSVEWSETI